MIFFKYTVQSEILLDGSKDFEKQLKDLKESFEEFYLIRYEFKMDKGCSYNKFTFTHLVKISCLHS